MKAKTTSDEAILAVGGFVYRFVDDHQVEVLLIKKKCGFWTLPKGKVEPGETEAAAVQREVWEETGITGTVGAQVQQVAYTIMKKGEPRCKVVTYYLLHAEDGELRPGKQERIEKLRWFPFQVALKRIQRGRVRKIVRHAGEVLREFAHE
ncbi:MAG TPA: NUDIX hydrolase [Roseiflexaceae bacterium]|jgi:8-oxo-dGTP pyrophosphatase MutT (NUDIX family)|nr:NUDIX hydrolase [Roseiflexaceae bacterium]